MWVSNKSMENQERKRDTDDISHCIRPTAGIWAMRRRPGHELYSSSIPSRNQPLSQGHTRLDTRHKTTTTPSFFFTFMSFPSARHVHWGGKKTKNSISFEASVCSCARDSAHNCANARATYPASFFMLDFFFP